jgi:hypothetical protein
MLPLIYAHLFSCRRSATSFAQVAQGKGQSPLKQPEPADA